MVINLAGSQWRLEPGGRPYGLDFGAVVNIAQACGVELSQTFFEKLSAFEAEAVESMLSARDACDEGRRKRCEFEYKEFFEGMCEKCNKKSKKPLEIGS